MTHIGRTSCTIITHFALQSRVIGFVMVRRRLTPCLLSREVFTASHRPPPSPPPSLPPQPMMALPSRGCRYMREALTRVVTLMAIFTYSAIDCGSGDRREGECRHTSNTSLRTGSSCSRASIASSMQEENEYVCIYIHIVALLVLLRHNYSLFLFSFFYRRAKGILNSSLAFSNGA